MNWIIAGIAAAFVLPPLLRAAASNPEALRKAAELTEQGREKAIELGKKGASASYEAALKRARATKAKSDARKAAKSMGAFGNITRRRPYDRY